MYVCIIKQHYACFVRIKGNIYYVNWFQFNEKSLYILNNIFLKFGTKLANLRVSVVDEFSLLFIDSIAAIFLSCTILYTYIHQREIVCRYITALLLLQTQSNNKYTKSLEWKIPLHCHSRQSIPEHFSTCYSTSNFILEINRIEFQNL